MGVIRIAALAIGGAVVLVTSPARSESAGNGDAEIVLLRQQMRTLEQKLERLEKQTKLSTKASKDAIARSVNDNSSYSDAKAENGTNAKVAVPGKSALPSTGVVVTMPNNRPTICTGDEQNCIGITSRVQWDVGGYDYRPLTAATVPQKLNSGENLRRARIGVVGKFLGDWNFALIYDFGGSSDGFGGAAPGSLPGGGVSGVENAYLSYTGLKPFGGKMAIEGGIMDLPYTLDEATSSNDSLFIERASAGVIATSIAAGDFRSAVGTRWYNDVLWAGGYVTGPATGAIHSASSVAPNGTSEQYGAVARVAGQLLSGDRYSLHVGADAQWLIQPPRNLVTGAQAVTLSDRPELRIDPTALVSTGAIANASGAQIYSMEAAATYGPLILQGEYFWFNVDRSANTGLPPIGAPDLKFHGGYAQAGLVLTGETHTYNPASASYSGIKPAYPFSLDGGTWGAWEIAGRVSTVDLNDQLGSATGISGGRQTVYTAALNWYVNGNVRFMLNYLHGNISRQATPTLSGDVGAKFDAVAMRTQFAF